MTVNRIDDRPGLFAYKTAPHFDGLAALDAFDPTEGADELSFEQWSEPLEPGWTDVQSFTFIDGHAGLLFVDATGQRIALGRVREDGSGVDIMRRAEDVASTDEWTMISRISRMDGTTPALMGYNRETGATWMIGPDPTGPDALRLGGPAGLPPEWDHLHILERQDGLIIFGQNEEGGSAQLMAAVDGEDRFLQLWEEPWRPGERLIELLPAPSSAVFVYEPGTGGWEVRSLGPTGSELAAEGGWRTGFSVLLPFNMHTGQHVLGYDASTGEVEVLRLNGQDGEVVWEYRWSEGWDVQRPLQWAARASH
ncbi:MAG: hypothetical protein AAFZ01_06970 [Pseudomonadota bacterium]